MDTSEIILAWIFISVVVGILTSTEFWTVLGYVVAGCLAIVFFPAVGVWGCHRIWL